MLSKIRNIQGSVLEPNLETVRLQPHVSLDRGIADSLREVILNGDLAPNTRLRQEDLAIHFHVSRIPIREALQQLESEGLITIEPRRGARVSALTPGQVRELFEMRIVLECLLLEKAVPKLDDRQINAARETLRKMNAPRTPKNYVQLNEAFHEGLYEAAERPMILEHVHRLRNNAKRYLRLNLEKFQRRRKAADEHVAILDACEARDADRASLVLRQHLSRVSTQIEELMTIRAEEDTST